MHRALYIRDIQDIILEQLPRADLARLARTCRDLQVPALRHLWRFVNDRKLRTLADIGNPICHMASRNPHPSVCPRLDMYCHLVRRAQLEFDIHPVRNGLLDAFFDRKMHQAVFPNLGKLSIWITESPDLTARVIPFMSSGIFRLDIKCGEAVNDRSDWDKCLVPLLDHARQTCPNLEHLSFMGTGLRLLTTLDKAFSALIDSCTHLMQFDISNIALGPLTVRALARAPRLLSLTVDNQFGDDRQFELSSPDMQGFAQLRKLALKDISIHVATQFLEKVTWMLSELTIKVYNDELPFKSVQDLSVALNECGRSLRCTTIILVDKSNDRRRRPLSLYPAILQSLCQSNHMRELFLQVESPSAVDVRDTDLEKMALAWPDLRTFCMTWTPADKHPRRSGLPVAISRGGLWDEAALTLNSLVPFVEQCPKLEKFSLTSINADVPYRHRDLLPTGLQPLALHVGRAEIEDPDSVAEFLYSILPNVKLSHNGVGHRWSRWAEVQNKLSGLQAPQKDSGLSTDPPTN